MGDLKERLREAANRIGRRDALMSIPVNEATDVDCILCQAADALTQAEALIEELAGALVGLQDRFYDVVYQETNGLGEYVEADKAKTALASYETWKGAQTSGKETTEK